MTELKEKEARAIAERVYPYWDEMSVVEKAQRTDEVRAIATAIEATLAAPEQEPVGWTP